MKYAIKDYDNDIYYKRGTYSWTEDLKEARIYDEPSSVNRAMPHAKSDALGVNKINERLGQERTAPDDPEKLVIQKVEMVPQKAGSKKGYMVI